MLWPCLQAYCCFAAPLVNGIASVGLAWVLWDDENRPLTICLNEYLWLSAIGVFALAGSLFLNERERKRRRTSQTT